MRFFQPALLAVSALASMALAQSTTLLFTKVPTSATVGTSYTLEWKTNDSTSPVTILLRKGPSDNLKTISTLTSTGAGGSYTWIPDKSLVVGTDYALQITQGKEVNYFGPFSITGGSLSAASSAASASASASSSASASLSQSVLSLTTVVGNSTASVTSLSAASTGKSNSTVSTASLSATTRATNPASTGASSTNTAAQGAPTGAAGHLGSSPMALIFGAVAAMAYLN